MGCKSHAYELTDGQKLQPDELTDQRSHAYELRMRKCHAGRKSSCFGVWKNGGAEIIANNQRNRNCQDADVKPIVRDPIDDDKIPVESGAEMTLFHMSLPSSKN